MEETRRGTESVPVEMGTILLVPSRQLISSCLFEVVQLDSLQVKGVNLTKWHSRCIHPALERVKPLGFTFTFYEAAFPEW